MVWVWGVCDPWQEALQLSQGRAGAEWQCQAGVRQAVGRAAAGHSGHIEELGVLVQGLGAVTVAGPDLYVDLGHWHLYPNGSQFPEKMSRIGPGEPSVLILTSNMTLNKLGPFHASLAHL